MFSNGASRSLQVPEDETDQRRRRDSARIAQAAASNSVNLQAPTSPNKVDLAAARILQLAIGNLTTLDEALNLENGIDIFEFRSMTFLPYCWFRTFQLLHVVYQQDNGS